MSGPEARKPDDTLLEEFMAGDGRLVRAYRSGETPGAPPALDEVVLKIARDELGRPVIVRAQGTRWRRLRLPVAAAATLVLSLSVLLAVQRDREASRLAFEMETAAPADVPPVVLEELAPQLAEPLPVIEQSADTQIPALSKSVGAPPPRAAADELKDERSTHEDAPLQEADRGNTESGPASAPAPAMAPSRPNTGYEKRERQTMAPAAAGALSQPSPAMEAGQPPEPAEAWLTRIRQLQSSQRYEEARRELREFRQIYPDYALPEDFKALEAEPSSSSTDR